MMPSQPARSASVSAVPAAINATLRGGCRASPSMKSNPSAWAKAAPMVLLPQPLTPITTTCTGLPELAVMAGGA